MENFIGGAAKCPTAQPTVPVRRHHNQVDMAALGFIDDHLGWVADQRHGSCLNLIIGLEVLNTMMELLVGALGEFVK
jgi:hypothetical protein